MVSKLRSTPRSLLGYGRAFRERLLKRWGVVDVKDCCSCAQFLVDSGKADGERLCSLVALLAVTQHWLHLHSKKLFWLELLYMVLLVQFCLYMKENNVNIPVTADSAEENPVMEFDMPVILIWFLLRVLTDDGDLENRKGNRLGEEVS
ncbi:putative bleomycin hydrolase [Helianthus debilis subsp. tardiflorus]